MSLHKKSEFRALSGGVSIQLLSTYIKRGKVIVDDNGYVDDSNPLNQSFLRKFQSKNGGAISIEDLSMLDRHRKKGNKIDPKTLNRDGVDDNSSKHKVPEKKVPQKKIKEPLKTKSPDEVDRVQTPAFSMSETASDLDSQKKKLEVEKLKKDIE